MPTIEKKIQEMLGQDYKIEGTLGYGMGTLITKVKHQPSNEYRAVKYALVDEDKEILRAGEILKKFKHPNIVKLICTKEKSLMIMEYIPGPTLSEKLNEGTLDEKIIAEITYQISKGINEIHNKDYVHGDINPTNIILTEENLVKIVDFGTAGYERKTAQFTDGYVSPEQLGINREGKIKKSSDIYSLGITLYQLFTHESPFEASKKIEAIFPKFYKINEIQKEMDKKEIIGEKLKEKSKSKICQKMIDIISKSIRYKEEDRYSSINQLIKDIDKLR